MQKCFNKKNVFNFQKIFFSKKDIDNNIEKLDYITVIWIYILLYFYVYLEMVTKWS